MTRILTVKEAAEALQVQEKTARAWLKQGLVPGKKVGRVWRINEDELLEAMRSTAPAKVEL